MIGNLIPILLGGNFNPIPTELSDGKTLEWWDWGTGIIADASNYVSSWVGRVNGVTLTQGAAGAQPFKGDGIIFDGGTDNMATGAITAINQPVTVYLCINQLSFTNSDTIIDLNSVTVNTYYQTFASTFTRLYAGAGINNSTSSYNIKQIHTLVINGASSSIQVNNLTKATGNAGAAQINRVMLANGLATSFGNIVFYDAIVRTQADSDTTQNNIKQFLARKNGVIL